MNGTRELTDEQKTSDLDFWLAKKNDLKRAIIYSDIDVKTDLPEPMIARIKSEIAQWMPSECDELTQACVYTDDNSDQLAFMKTRVHSDDIGGIYEETEGPWSPDLAAIMRQLRLVLTKGNPLHYLFHDIEKFPLKKLQGWTIKEWKAEYIDTKRNLPGTRKVVCDIVTWERDIENIEVIVVTKQGWAEYGSGQ